jgi:ankyrin repeat protein
MKSQLIAIVAAVVLMGCQSISIHQAVFDGNIEAVKQHLAAGAEVDAKDDEFVATFLHWAAAGGQNEIVELLITNGADVNAKDSLDGTPLHLAAREGHMETAELLIAEGAYVNAKTADGGGTPLDVAIQFKELETADIIRKHGGKTGVELSIHKAAEAGNIEAVKQHLAAGADVNAKEVGDKWTPLHNAAWGGHKEIAELLIAKGADVNAKDDEGMTPLHPAAAAGHREIAELLIAKGVDVNAKVASGSKQGLTALDAANETDQTETAVLLRKHGGKTGEELKAEGN